MRSNGGGVLKDVGNPYNTEDYATSLLMKQCLQTENKAKARGTLSYLSRLCSCTVPVLPVGVGQFSSRMQTGEFTLVYLDTVDPKRTVTPEKQNNGWLVPRFYKAVIEKTEL